MTLNELNSLRNFVHYAQYSCIPKGKEESDKEKFHYVCDLARHILDLEEYRMSMQPRTQAPMGEPVMYGETPSPNKETTIKYEPRILES